MANTWNPKYPVPGGSAFEYGKGKAVAKPDYGPDLVKQAADPSNYPATPKGDLQPIHHGNVTVNPKSRNY